jgi:hypothetical protein
MSTAIFGLVGAVVGAIIVGANNYCLAVRRERADRERDDRNRAIVIKTAARLIDADLSRAGAAAKICVEKRRWWPSDVRQLSDEAWEKYSPDIAPVLPNQAWADVLTAIEAVDDLKRFREIAVETELVANSIPDTTAEQIVPVLTDIKNGRAALAPFVFDSPSAAGK